MTLESAWQVQKVKNRNKHSLYANISLYRLRSASWIRITSPSLTFVCLDLYFIFFVFPSETSDTLYSPLHRFHKTSLHWRRYFTLFLKSASPYSMLSSGMSLGWLNIVAHGVKTGSWASASTYDGGRLFGATSTSSKTSSSSFNVRLAWQILLYYGCFKTPISLSKLSTPTRGLCLDKIATLFPDERGSSEAVHVLPRDSITSLKQQNFARYSNKSSWGSLFSW